MFKNFMKWVIDNLIESYEETYGCEELTKEFYQELKNIREKNKIIFLEKEVENICKHYKKINRKIPPFKTVKTMAEVNFIKKKAEGGIDDLNKIVTKKKGKGKGK